MLPLIKGYHSNKDRISWQKGSLLEVLDYCTFRLFFCTSVMAGQVGSIWYHKNLQHKQSGFIWKPDYPWSYDHPLPNIILSYKALTNHEVAWFPRLFASFGYLQNNFPPKGFKIFPIESSIMWAMRQKIKFPHTGFKHTYNPSIWKPDILLHG